MSKAPLIDRIRAGISSGEFELYYQPKLDLSTGETCGFEALLRWRHDGEVRGPNQFLPAAEASDVIGPLTDHVFDLALGQAAAWRAGGREVPVAVNISAANLADDAVVGWLEQRLTDHRLPAELITLEVTETAVLEKPETARAVLSAIAALGVGISVDDFGTGYASLQWLRMFPVNQVKIDRSFVSSIVQEGDAYVAGAVHLGQELGLAVVAEGIEQLDTLRRLQELGCDIGQGYLFAKPMPACEVEAWIDSHTPESWSPPRREILLGAGELDLDSARELIAEVGAEFGLNDAAIWEMRLAATEALTNAIEHGKATEGGVRLRLLHERDRLVIEISGGGGGTRVNAGDARSRGRGIAMMTALMDGLELSKVDGNTHVRMSKRRSAPSAPAA
jgi:EAL domain-containing protein (putative c-di-GMP-specific phosphodiesterase class I)/anti-sigma regulatory factor (Ser/Thr protein kinase)